MWVNGTTFIRWIKIGRASCRERADAVIKGNKVVVSNKDVKHPVAVRYAWSDNPSDANLCNKDGLLAAPFRTDNW